MQIKGMNGRLIDINNIRNLTSVKIWDMVYNTSPSLLVVPAIMITYDGGNVINLCAKDDYFNELVRKVIEVYQDEKDNILEDSLTDPFHLCSKIDIDEKTKAILTSGTLTKKDAITSFYQDKEYYSSSLLFQIDEVRSLIPLIKYHIEKFFSKTNQNVLIGQEFSGYRDNYYLSSTLNGIETPLPITYEKESDNDYTFYIGNLLGKNRPLKLTISYKKDSLEIIVSSSDFNIAMTSTYRITNGIVKEIHDMEKDNLTLSYENNDLPESPLSTKYIADCDESTNLKWFSLPWQDQIGISTSIDEVSETEKIIEVHSMFTSTFDTTFSKREYYSKTYKRNKTMSIDGTEVVISELRKKLTGVKTDNIYIIETSFDNGIRYYYHGIVSEDPTLIDQSNLSCLTKQENINNSSDLLNKHKLHKILRSE